MQPRRDISIRVISTLEEIEAIATAWRGLEAHCADPLGYFQSYDWCRNWVRQVGSKSTEPYVITAWRGDQLVALWPCMVVQAAGIKRLETLGFPHSQYCGILVRRENVALLVIAQRFNAVMKGSGCDVILCRAILDGTMLAEVLAEMPEVPLLENAASMLDLSA